MSVSGIAGHYLDGKYRIERELGRGGMGTVYLATHLGTERPVAVKVISPEYMQRSEFVERFRREARAAGRLRHPNVVNVTDFGFANTEAGEVAYLVMEYLDGCTLGEILDEERNLPVAWTLDILDQVCSAVHEAHGQGIIHRDLKPDNIWLEPNQRGGYTVKVLDFGIAKLEEHEAAALGAEDSNPFRSSQPTFAGRAGATLARGSGGTMTEAAGATKISEAATMAQTEFKTEASTVFMAPVAVEGETAIFSDGDISGEIIVVDPRARGGTRGAATSHSLYESNGSAELTRVGAVLGTPLYMSPEQCRGEHLDPRSDIYSLGVIAYQMLSGAPPFEGDYRAVMDSHQNTAPAPLKTKHVRKKLRRVIYDALEKDPSLRPHTAEGFASELRARADGIFGLLRQASIIYSEHLPKFLLLSSVLFLPGTLITFALLLVAFLLASEVITAPIAKILIACLAVALTLANAFSASMIVGCITWIVTQYRAVPLRPVRLRPGLFEARRKWKSLVGAGAATALLPFVAATLGAIAGFLALAALGGIVYPLTGSTTTIWIAGSVGAIAVGLAAFFIAYIRWMLAASVVMMEKVTIRESLRRSRQLVKRATATAAAAALLMFLLPILVSGAINALVYVTARAYDPPPAVTAPVPDEAPSAVAVPAVDVSSESATLPLENDSEKGFRIRISGEEQTNRSGAKKDMRSRIKSTLLDSLVQVIFMPMQIIVISFSGIIVALLYMKTRLAGGESMAELIERFEDDGRPRKKWQERVRQRLIQSGRISGNTNR